jgi:hypothetical protein
MLIMRAENDANRLASVDFQRFRRELTRRSLLERYLLACRDQFRAPTIARQKPL